MNELIGWRSFIIKSCVKVVKQSLPSYDWYESKNNIKPN